ncbi:MAG: glycosyltransferase family 4 protein [Thermoplasmata archaeon]
MKIISIGNTPLTNLQYGGTIGIILHLTALSRFADVTYINCSRFPEVNPKSLPFEVLNVPISSKGYLVQKGISGILRPFTIIPSVPIVNEINMFLSPNTRKKVKTIVADYAKRVGEIAILFESPMGNTLVDSLHDYPKVLRAHNFEAEYFRSHTKPTYYFNKLFYNYFEGQFAKKCNLIFSISKEDMIGMSEYYKIEKNKFIYVPASIDTKKIKPFTEEEKQIAKAELDLVGKKVAVFIGGGSVRDRVLAVPTITRLAEKFENLYFLIAGKISKLFTPRKNLRLMGYIDEETKKLCLAAADFALNPTAFGTGMNIKMLEYLAYGLPVITTPEGTRGFSLIHGSNAFVCHVESFEEVIETIIHERIDCVKIGKSGRTLVEKEYDAAIVGKRAVDAILRLLKRD